MCVVPTRAVYNFRFELEYDSETGGAATPVCQDQFQSVIASRLGGVASNLAQECDAQIDNDNVIDVVVTPQLSGDDLTLRYDTTQNKVGHRLNINAVAWCCRAQQCLG